jgi:uncharacterized membrane protein
VTQSHPVAERYLSRLTENLASLEAADRKEVVDELRNHLAESVSAGRSIDEVIEALGPAETLAKAYSVELLVNPRHDRRRARSLETTLKLIGLVAIGSIPTIVVFATLGSLGVSFLATGIVCIVVGTWALAAPLPDFVSLTIHPIWAVVMGPGLMLLGYVALRALALYLRFLTRAFRAVIPRSPARQAA